MAKKMDKETKALVEALKSKLFDHEDIIITNAKQAGDWKSVEIVFTDEVCGVLAIVGFFKNKYEEKWTILYFTAKQGNTYNQTQNIIKNKLEPLGLE